MKKGLGLLLVATFLSSCATTVWVNPNKSQEEFYQDKLACEERANQLAWQRYPQPSSTMIKNTIYNNSTDEANQDRASKDRRHDDQDPYEYQRSRYHDEISHDCLKSKGWVREVVEK